MTTIIAGGRALNMESFDLTGVFDYDFVDFNSTAVTFFDDASNFLKFTGTDFTFSISPLAPTGGIVNSVTLVENGVTMLTVSDLAIETVELYNLLLAGDGDALWDAVMGGADTITGSDFRDVLVGDKGFDTINGGFGNDLIKGEAGNDILFGNAGKDRMFGGGGNDKLDGGNTSDFLNGGLGRDIFVFSTEPGATNIDTIADFTVADDTIHLSSAIFGRAGPAGTLEADRFVIGSAALDGLDKIIYDPATGALLYDRDGSGSAAARQFAQLAPGLALTHEDFVII